MRFGRKCNNDLHLFCCLQGFAQNLVKACETVDALEQTGDVGDTFSQP